MAYTKNTRLLIGCLNHIMKVSAVQRHSGIDLDNDTCVFRIETNSIQNSRMSDCEDMVDDTEFIVKCAEKSEHFVKEQVNIVLTEVGSLRKTVGQLEQRLNVATTELQSVKEENARLHRQQHCTCKETLRKTFIAGLAAAHEEGNSDAVTPGTSGVQVTHDTSEDGDGQEDSYSAKKLPIPFVTTPLKRKEPDFQLVEKLEDLDPTMRHQIMPFYKEDRRATADMLNYIQRAYIKYRTNKVTDNKEAITPSLITKIIEEGVGLGIWPPNFQPVNMLTSFAKYIGNRIKNEKKSILKKRYLDSQEQRLNQSVTSGDVVDPIDDTSEPE